MYSLTVLAQLWFVQSRPTQTPVVYQRKGNKHPSPHHGSRKDSQQSHSLRSGGEHIFELVKQMLESIFKLVTFNVCKYCLIVTVHLFHHFIYCLLLFIFYIPLLVRNKKIFSIQFNTFTRPSQRLTQKTIPVTKQSTPNPNLSKCPYLKKRGSKRAVKISLAWVVNGPLRG